MKHDTPGPKSHCKVVASQNKDFHQREVLEDRDNAAALREMVLDFGYLVGECFGYNQ